MRLTYKQKTNFKMAVAFNRVCKLSKKIPNSLRLSPFSSTSSHDWEPKEKETHTGQKWDANDYRLVRFIDKEKQVNPNWAIKLIAEVPPIRTKERVVSCDGGSGPTGHPKVYINLDKPGNHSCTYCGLRFYKEDHH